MSVHLNIDDDAWEPAGIEDPLDCLLVTCWINSVPHHLEAIAVTFDDDGCISAVDPSYDDKIDAMTDLSGQAPRSTVDVGDRQYLLSMVAYS